MRIFILILLMCAPFIGFGQPFYTIDWNGATTISPWSVAGVNTINVTNQWSCEGTHSIRMRLQGNGNLRSATLVSGKLGTTQGGEVTF